MLQKEFPILEFDEDRNAFIRPSIMHKPIDGLAERCVLCFFSDAIEKILAGHQHKTFPGFLSEGINYPLYELDYKGEKIALMQAAVGAPLAVGQIEELAAMGCKKFIACGMCGVLQKELAVGHLVIPTAAVRDEGASYHYVKPAREITANERVVRVIEDTLLEKKIPYIKAKTWTTDAFYRETPNKIAQRKSEGCVTVEMEASAYMAVSQYLNVEFGQILCSGDSLAGDEWDSRNYVKRIDIKEYVLGVTLDTGINM
ncbi:MAG: nucleoside phosphorylase [Treponema sp.]|jgi:uridine phosphorylase|nr:nucleoside phosphorylase [Treponema sp.]